LVPYGDGSTIRTADEKGASERVPANFVDVTSIIGWVSVNVLSPLVSLRKKETSALLVRAMGERWEFESCP
jgi:hypothetical protein